MDSLAPSFACGMGGEDFGSVEFQTPVAGDGDAGSSLPLHSAVETCSSFITSASRNTVFQQGNPGVYRASDMDLQCLTSASCAQHLQISSAAFIPVMSPRLVFSTSGLPAISTFSDAFLRQMYGSRDTGLANSITQHPPSVRVMMEAGASPRTNTIIPYSEPVFPTSQSSLMHTSMAAAGMNQMLVSGPGSSESVDDFETGNKPASVNTPGQTLSSSGAMQNCYHCPVSVEQQTQNYKPRQLTGQSLSPLNAQAHSQDSCKNSKPFVGSVEQDTISCTAVTTIQRHHKPPLCTDAMDDQGAAVAVISIETERRQLPTHATSCSQVGKNKAVFVASAENLQDCLPPSSVTEVKLNISDHWQNDKMCTAVMNTYVYGKKSVPCAIFPQRHMVVPFFKAGRFCLREPEVFDCQTRKVPQVTESVQTGHDMPFKELTKYKKSLFPCNPSLVDFDLADGKGGFPVLQSGFEHKSTYKKAAGHSSVVEKVKPCSDGEGCTKRGNSKTVMSPSFGEAAARAVMRTLVSDSTTVVTVGIMSQHDCSLQPNTSSSEVSSGSSHDIGMSTVGIKKQLCHVSVCHSADPHQSEEENCRAQPCRAGHADSMPSMAHTFQRGHSLQRRMSQESESLENSNDFERLMEERKKKARAAEQERMEISIRIDDSQCVTYGEQKRWQCDLCDKSYTTKHNLVMHMLDHNGIKPHLCLVCGKYFKQLSHLNTHMLTHDKVRPHTCDLCGKGFTQIGHLKRHRTVHQQSKPYSCDQCGHGFCFPSELHLHKEQHQQEIVPGQLACQSCDQEFSSGTQLKQHMLIHDNQDDHSCQFCHRTFRYPSQLKDHIIVHSGSRPYMCMECGMDFMKEHHLRAHQFTHTGLRPYSCSECGRSFNQRANMLRHRLIHRAERSYRCDYCEKTFTQPQTLKAHMVVHADHKPYKCNECGKEFGRLHNLHGHMHMHSDSKPYVCFCGSSFTLKGNLNRHKKVKHGLNESTESMEEDAVHFLSSWSERAREERSGDDTMDDADANGFDIDISSMDRVNSRKQRKSKPRKIPQRSAGSGTRMSKEDGGQEEEWEEEDEDRLMRTEQAPSFNFQAVTDHSASPADCDSYNIQADHTRQVKTSELTLKRTCQGHRQQHSVDQNSDFVAGWSDSDDRDVGDDGCHDDQDDDWTPSLKNFGKGTKLDSLIAEKFSSC